ncbi:hypothetical protein [Nesterenkonia jeotgali]|uniref:Uncharacterized protein n=1 Tax=Nesterenkonia jeotgali TaxID=317018 RepID=A0A0W8IG10_9MICC|nr:hypothetical protein [Nesterenkonia jeotgali]KUG58962.1 hypothetical protein AVL63_02765 [Nesterenkonia jeotgali]
MSTNDTRTADAEHDAYHRSITEASKSLFEIINRPETSVRLYGATPSMIAQLAAYPVWEAAMKFKAEPTTVTAEQIETAAMAEYEHAQSDPSMSYGPPWSQLSETAKAPYLNRAKRIFRAAGFRIEGDPDE